jgi:hypothetical protein
MIRIACAAALCAALVLSGLETTSAADRSLSMDDRIAQAKDLFLADRLTEALDALDERTLERSGEANLLAGLIHLYRRPIDGAAANCISNAPARSASRMDIRFWGTWPSTRTAPTAQPAHYRILQERSTMDTMSKRALA